ncbi:MAG TPA: class I adenylate-forming enzyme family protein, partial [Acidimicrobiia bacterium]|nr:class I adenylate-forming enzyme family protein [Acidimicrobiia bacterium]
MGERPQTTVLEALMRRLAADPDGPYLDFEGDEYTARRMEAESNRLARALAGLGVGKSDRVATLLENGPAQAVSFFAALKLGAVQVPVNTAYKGDFLRHQLADSGSKVIVAQGDFAGRV